MIGDLNYKIAVITPKNKSDYLANTVLDGLSLLQKENKELKFLASVFSDRNDFCDFAKNADLVFFVWGKNNTDYDLVYDVDCFYKTVFIDGSEVGRDGRFDTFIQQKILEGSYNGNGKIDKEMLDKCSLYFRREKPYINGILPLPFGIENKYKKYYSNDAKKDIDFFCVFGQEKYPKMRKLTKDLLVSFCHKNGFTCFVDKTDPDNFYKMLGRSKVGISIGGGGYDTARFWEILANNCLLLTEKIDIYELDSERLKYDRIWQFNNLFDFQYQLEKMGDFLKKKYKLENLSEEYEKIMREHSSKARVLEIINTFNNLKNGK